MGAHFPPLKKSDLKRDFSNRMPFRGSICRFGDLSLLGWGLNELRSRNIVKKLNFNPKTQEHERRRTTTTNERGSLIAREMVTMGYSFLHQNWLLNQLGGAQRALMPVIKGFALKVVLAPVR